MDGASGNACITGSVKFQAEDLVALILDETPEAMQAFATREEMVSYVREALQYGCKG